MRFHKIEAQQKPSFPHTNDNRRNWVGFKVLLLVLLVLVVIASIVYWTQNRKWVITTGAIVAYQVQMASPLTGRVVSIAIREGDEVVEGQLLARLSDEEILAELKQAEAGLDGARSRLEARRKAGIDPAEAAKVEAAKRDLDLVRERYQIALAEVKKTEIVRERARLVAKRMEQVFLLKAVTRDRWERTVADWRLAESEHGGAKAALSEAAAAVRGAQNLLAKANESLLYAERKMAEELEDLGIRIKQSEAEVDQAKSKLAQTEIHAPRAGLVSWNPRRPGEVVDQNDTVLTLLDPEEVWVEAYVRGKDLYDIRDGKGAWVRIDGTSDHKYRGEVSLFYPQKRPPDDILSVGPERARSPSRLSTLIHPVKIVFKEDVPQEVWPGMIVRVWIARR